MDEKSNKQKLREIAQLKKRIEELYTIIESKQENWDFSRTWEEYKQLTIQEYTEIYKLDRKLRLTRPYEVSDIPDYGDVITLNEFKNSCRNGLFVNYDGFGKYLDGDKMTDIEIYPSDVKNHSVRHEFNRIIWFNK